MPIPNEYVRVVGLLVQQTQAGKLMWRQSGVAGEYVVKLPDYSVVVSINRFIESFDRRSRAKSPVNVQVLLPEGMEIASFDVSPDEADYARVRPLYDTASGQAMDKSQMAEQLARQLEAKAG